MALDSIITVNSEIFARILFSQMASKDIFATLKICDKGMIYLYQISPLHEGFISQKFAYAKFRENKTLSKISECTAIPRHVP